MKKTLLTITALALAAALPTTSHSTIPVIDYSAILESVKQGLEQIKQYTTQLSQLQYAINSYKSQILQATGLAQAAQIWSQVQGSMNQVLGTVNMFRSGAGVQGYMNQFRDVNYWLATTPTSPAVYQTQGYWSTSQKTANDQLVKEIQQQEEQIQSDSALLQRLQGQAGSVETYRQAMDVSNELAGLQSKQLMEIRSLMVSEQQALAAKNGAAATDDALRKAATEQYYGTVAGAQAPMEW